MVSWNRGAHQLRVGGPSKQRRFQPQPAVSCSSFPRRVCFGLRSSQCCQNYVQLDMLLNFSFSLFPLLFIFISEWQNGNRAHCGNFRILLPLRFYVKSILVILQPKNHTNLTTLAALNFQFLGIFCHFQLSNFHKIKIQSLQNCQNDIFCPFFISQNRFHVKYKWQKIG